MREESGIDFCLAWRLCLWSGYPGNSFEVVAFMVIFLSFTPLDGRRTEVNPDMKFAGHCLLPIDYSLLSAEAR